jgi:hypothetical protein
MKKVAGLLGLVIALGIGWYIFKLQWTQGPMHGAPPKRVIDVVGVKSDLVTIGEAERMYLASHGSYATIQQLYQDNSIDFSGENRRGYNYTAEVEDGQHFMVTATPVDPAKAGWPTLSIDDSMQVSQQ